MSTADIRLPFATANDLAQRIAAELAEACERVEIAGSLRRRRPDIGDIELVAIPRYAPDLFGGPGQSLLAAKLADLETSGRLIPANRGEALIKYYLPALRERGLGNKLELYISTPERWAVEFAIWTGSAQFSHRLVTARKFGGFLPSDCKIKDGWQIWQAGERLQFAEEQEFIEWACGKWVAPEERT